MATTIVDSSVLDPLRINSGVGSVDADAARLFRGRRRRQQQMPVKRRNKSRTPKTTGRMMSRCLSVGRSAGIAVPAALAETLVDSVVVLLSEVLVTKVVGCGVVDN